MMYYLRIQFCRNSYMIMNIYNPIIIRINAILLDQLVNIWIFFYCLNTNFMYN